MPTNPQIGPYSRPATLAKLDERTKEARLVRETRAELTAHCGGKPSATQAALIDQLVQLKLRLAVMDRKFAEAGAQTDHDSRVYLAWANAYSRMLGRMGMKGAPERAPTLADYIATRAATVAPGGLASPVAPSEPAGGHDRPGAT